MFYPLYKSMNFREFLEHTSVGSFTTDGEAKIPAYDGKLFPQVTLDFPTVTKRGEVFKIKVKGACYVFYLYDPQNMEIEIEVKREDYHKKYNRLPIQRRTINGETRPGDMMTAVYYKYKKRGEPRHQLQSFELDVIR